MIDQTNAVVIYSIKFDLCRQRPA